jgi:peptidoglycan hydrolase-like amidase
MERRKKILIGIVSIVVVIVVLLVGAYPTVTVAKISSTLKVSKSSPYDVTEEKVLIKVARISYMDYTFSNRRSVNEREKDKADIVTLEVIFDLSTPTGTNLTIGQFDLAGEGFKEFNLVVGPNEGLTESGTFVLFIKIHLTVKPPTGFKMELTKTISKTFEVP